jgi:hypothetical protein
VIVVLLVKPNEMKKALLNIAALLTVFVMLVSCATTDLDRKVNFNHYRTFAWGPSEIKTENPVYNSDLINKNIKATIENEFARRGIVVDNTNPDFIVSFHTYTEKAQSYQRSPYYGGPFMPFGFYGMGWGWGMPYWGMPYGGYGYGSSLPYTYTKGTLIIDVTDRKTNETVWRGTVAGNVDNVKKLERQIQKGVVAIMKKYPGAPQPELDFHHKPIS